MQNIKTLSAIDRPREKLLLNGPTALTNAEILAILLGSGIKQQPVAKLCERVLENVGFDLETLAGLTLDELCQFKGIGIAKGAIILAAMELGRRRLQRPIPNIKSDADAINSVIPHFKDTTKRLFVLVLLNRNYELLATCELKNELPEVSHLLQLVTEAGACRFGLVRNVRDDPSEFLAAETKMLTDLEDAAAMVQLKYLGRLLLE